MILFKWNLQLFAGEEELDTENGVETEEVADLGGEDEEETPVEESEDDDEESEEETAEDDAEESTGEDEDKHPLNDSKAFAERLKKKTEKIEQQMKEQYGAYYKVIEREAKKYDMTPQEYIKALDEQAAEEEAERIAKEEAEKAEKYKGLSKEEIEALEWAKENKAKVELANKYKEQATEFKKAFPNVDPKSIPDVVYEMFDKYGVPYTETYKKFVQTSQNSKTARIQAEQEALRKLQETKSPGSLTGNGTQDTQKSVKDMTSAEFQAYLERVKRGEIKK